MIMYSNSNVHCDPNLAEYGRTGEESTNVSNSAAHQLDLPYRLTMEDSDKLEITRRSQRTE